MVIKEFNTNDLDFLKEDNELKYIFSNKQLYVAYNNDKIIGAYQIDEIPLGIELRIGIVKSERNKGYGKYLLNLAYKHSCELYSDKNTVVFITKNNNISYNLALKCGFALDENMNYEYTCMTKRIPSKKVLK